MKAAHPGATPDDLHPEIAAAGGRVGVGAAEAIATAHAVWGKIGDDRTLTAYLDGWRSDAMPRAVPEYLRGDRNFCDAARVFARLQQRGAGPFFLGTGALAQIIGVSRVTAKRLFRAAEHVGVLALKGDAVPHKRCRTWQMCEVARPTPRAKASQRTNALPEATLQQSKRLRELGGLRRLGDIRGKAPQNPTPIPAADGRHGVRV